MKHFTCHHNPSKKNSLILSIALCIALLYSAFSFSQELSSNDAVGVFVFESETIDYGTIQQNDNGIRTFKFKNRGRAPIVISKVKTTCGCTVPTYPKQAILPGESATIDIKYATSRLGKFSKSITVFSNADQPQKRLQIKGNVVAKASKTIK
ncbi:DUF1573 domain-containing protein [Psychroserpens algicola]|uniref:DUF1573 domain-containing protein n=1 Tax=Psychroserpens algicola TaxID=1719034 RepID=A0ABT0H8U5_9FLAO|nr:DUF1573 domain-containing protein [Psychroserpens algicola]MCK8480783.1 DUF1573 domain-containing protein [Psychroserpens algicola]